ncbi:MAG TPA: helix-turn-helix domain-containing protein [Polyangia bacterium]|jgi:AcrR family transcriptional regulator
MPAASPRRARHVAQTRARILQTAARRFAAAGIAGVRLDEIADAADVARGTLYNYFPTKDALVTAILRPVLEHAAAGVAGLAQLGPRRGVEALLALYLELWRRYPAELRCTARMEEQPLEELAPLHLAFLRGAIAVLERAARARLLRTGDAVLTARTLARVAVPLLELYEGEQPHTGLFLTAMRGLLLVESDRTKGV